MGQNPSREADSCLDNNIWPCAFTNIYYNKPNIVHNKSKVKVKVTLYPATKTRGGGL
jgi:hypothetical protein